MSDDNERPIPWEQVVPEDMTDPDYVAAVEAESADQERIHDLYHLSLPDLRKARALTQVQLASALGITQAEVSRVEHQADLLLSTIAGYIAAAGGSLRLLVEFADRDPVALDIGALELAQRRPAAITTETHGDDGQEIDPTTVGDIVTNSVGDPARHAGEG